MERYETQKIKVNGKPLIFYSWRFTDDEKANLKIALAKFPDEKVNLFINDLEVICLAAKNYLNERNVIFQRSEKKRMLGHFEKAEKDLYALIDKHRDSKQNIPLIEKSNILDYTYLSDSMILEKERLHYLMLTAASQLKEIVGIIKSESASKTGRPSNDVATGELVKIIAHAFQSHFERPTGHVSSVNANINPSPFYPVVQIALEACGLPHENPRRHIQAALKII